MNPLYAVALSKGIDVILAIIAMYRKDPQTEAEQQEWLDGLEADLTVTLQRVEAYTPKVI